MWKWNWKGTGKDTNDTKKEKKMLEGKDQVLGDENRRE